MLEDDREYLNASFSHRNYHMKCCLWCFKSKSIVVPKMLVATAVVVVRSSIVRGHIVRNGVDAIGVIT